MCAKRENWKPGLLERHRKNVQDKHMRELILHAKPGVEHQLPAHILQYKEYRKKNKTGGYSRVERFEFEHQHAAHHRNLKNIKTCTDTSAPAAAMSAALFMKRSRYTRGGVDKVTLRPHGQSTPSISRMHSLQRSTRYHEPWLAAPGDALPPRRCRSVGGWIEEEAATEPYEVGYNPPTLLDQPINIGINLPAGDDVENLPIVNAEHHTEPSLQQVQLVILTRDSLHGYSCRLCRL